jgi:hypothetical protein
MPILNFFKSFKIFFRYESNFHSPGKIKLNDNLSINLFYIQKISQVFVLENKSHKKTHLRLNFFYICLIYY